MGAASATFTPNNFPDAIENTLDDMHFRGTVVISADPDTYPANGVPVSPKCSIPYSDGRVVDGRFQGVSGYQYYYDYTNKTIRAYLGGTEVATNAAIPAAVHGDTIHAEFTVRRGQL